MPTVDEVKQVRNRLNAYRGNRVLAVAIKLRGVDWRHDSWTAAPPQPGDTGRGTEYHDKGKTPASFVKLKNACNDMIRAQDNAGRIWTQPDRNKTGMLSKLHEQIVLVEAGRSVQQMENSDDWEVRKAFTTG